jgi:hypothetical protein
MLEIKALEATQRLPQRKNMFVAMFICFNVNSINIKNVILLTCKHFTMLKIKALEVTQRLPQRKNVFCSKVYMFKCKQFKY